MEAPALQPVDIGGPAVFTRAVSSICGLLMAAGLRFRRLQVHLLMSNWKTIEGLGGRFIGEGKHRARSLCAYKIKTHLHSPDEQEYDCLKNGCTAYQQEKARMHIQMTERYITAVNRKTNLAACFAS